MGKDEGLDWATNRKNPKANFTINSLPAENENLIACLTETKASHRIPKSYQHAMTTDPD